MDSATVADSIKISVFLDFGTGIRKKTWTWLVSIIFLIQVWCRLDPEIDVTAVFFIFGELYESIIKEKTNHR